MTADAKAGSRPPGYEPPSLIVIGTLEELTLATMSGSGPDFTFNTSP